MSRILESRSFDSPAVGEQRYSIYLPHGYDNSERRYPTVYLLHGSHADETDWLRFGNVAHRLDRLVLAGEIPPVIVVMPDGKDSWYVNAEPGRNHETAIAVDLVNHVDGTYRTVAERRQRAIAGLSMGGYGTLRLAFAYSDRFCAVASMGGALFCEPPPAMIGDQEREALFRGAFGSPFDPERYDAANPFGMVGQMASSPHKVGIYLMAGNDDAYFLYEGATQLYTQLRRAGIPAKLRIIDGPHWWDTWLADFDSVFRFISSEFIAKYLG